MIHGTTLVINAILERKGARTGLLTTRGFRDVLELAREMRYAAYDVFAQVPEPLVPRQRRLEVNERLRADRTVLETLDEPQAREAARALGALGVKSVAVCLLNSFANPMHERTLKRLLAEELQMTFEDEGARVVGPALSLLEALETVTHTPKIDVAVLDVNLNGEDVYPIAELLLQRGVPFLFLTGYSSRADLTMLFPDAVTLVKPMGAEALIEQLLRLLR